FHIGGGKADSRSAPVCTGGRSVIGSVLVGDLDLVGVAATPHEADAPLVVDADAVLALAVAVQGLKPVARRNAEVPELRGGVEHHELAVGTRQEVGGQPPNALPAEYPLGVVVGEGLDHAAARRSSLPALNVTR